MERLRILRVLGLIIDHTSADERLRMGPDVLAGEFGLDPATTRAAYHRLEAVGALHRADESWTVPGASRLHGQQLRPADALDLIAAILDRVDAPGDAAPAPTADATPAGTDTPAPTGPAPANTDTPASIGPAPAETDTPAPIGTPARTDTAAGTESPAFAAAASTETPEHTESLEHTGPALVPPAESPGPEAEAAPAVATLAAPGRARPVPRIGSSVLVAAALVVAVGIANLLFDGSRATTPMQVATGPTTSATTPGVGVADVDALDPLVPRSGARATSDTTPTAPDTTTSTSSGPPAPATTAPNAIAAEPVAPLPGPLGADPPGELTCPAPPPAVTITTTAAVSQLDFRGWILVVQGVVEGHPDHDIVLDQVIAHIVIKDTEVTAGALDEPVALAAGERHEWQAELSVPTGSAPPDPRADLGAWHWADPAHTDCP